MLHDGRQNLAADRHARPDARPDARRGVRRGVRRDARLEGRCACSTRQHREIDMKHLKMDIDGHFDLKTRRAVFDVA